MAYTYGNTAVIYFGYPQAHEDDPERAVRGALELVTAVAALNTPASLQTRVGIATGLVIVGEISDAGGAQERGIVGETPNLAARLQVSPSRMRSSLLTVHGNYSAICSSSKI